MILLKRLSLRGGGGFYHPPDTREGLFFLLSKTVGMPPILDITPQLILPENLPLYQCLLVPLLHSFYQLYGNIVISTSITPIVVSQAPYFILNLPLMVAVPILEGGSTFPHILPPTLLTGCKINKIRGITSHFLPDVVCFSCVCALKCSPLL